MWGLALTMVECVTGRPPIEGDRVAMMGTVLDTVRRPSPRREGATVSDEVEAVFVKALAVDPRSRYQDIESFWTELEKAQGLSSSFERLRRSAADVSLPPPSDRSGSYPISSPPPAVSDAPGPSFDLALSQPPIEHDTASKSGSYAASSKSGSFPAYRPGGPQPRLARQPEPAPRRLSLGERIKGPLLLGAVALIATVLDVTVAGGSLGVGPVKLRWLAGLLVVVALVWALSSLVDKDEG